MSTMCITRPPSSFPSGLVSAGSTTSAISDAEALTGLPFSSGSPASLAFLFLDFFIVSASPPAHWLRVTGNVYYEPRHDRPKQIAPREIAGIRRAKSQRLLLALRAGPRIPQRRRLRRRRQAL